MSTTDEHNEINDGQLDPELIEDHLDEEGGEGVEGEHDGQQSLENQLADWEEKYQRALADYQNFQRRARENEERAREQGASDILKSLIPVLDNCQLALMLDPETTSAEQVLGGVKGIVDQFFASLERHGLAPIRPEAGDEFNPGHHEAMLRVESDEVDPGAIVQVLQIGYELRGRVVRPAQVSVRPAEGEG